MTENLFISHTAVHVQCSRLQLLLYWVLMQLSVDMKYCRRLHPVLKFSLFVKRIALYQLCDVN